MKEIIITDKKKYLEENYPFVGVPELSDKQRCIHCYNIFVVADYKVYKDRSGFEFICCPHTPDCNGTVIDWIDLINA